MIKYAVYRGNTDFVRECIPDGDTHEWPINKFIVGFPPQNPLSRGDQMFFTQSRNHTACKNVTDAKNNGDCYLAFARDRSLSAPDWKFIIPELGLGPETGSDGAPGVNKWILGEDVLDQRAKPVITDIKLYIWNTGNSIIE